jgi:uncharacterized protein YhfF
MADLATWWAECVATLGLGDVPAPAARRLGRTAELCERLLGLVLSRQKTGVFSDPADFPDGRLPSVGGLQLLADFTGAPRALVRYDECTVLPFNAVTAAHVHIESPALRDLEAWRRFHRRYWEPALAARGVAFRDDLPVVYQRFTCLYPPP